MQELNEILKSLESIKQKAYARADDHMQEVKNRQKDLFELQLKNQALNEFGIKYVSLHDSKQVTKANDIQKHIISTLHQKQGYSYMGVPGSGKTHILLEYYLQVLRSRFHSLEQDVQGTLDYPSNYPAWMKKLCKYYYSSWITEMIRNREKPVIAEINLIDDLMVEEISGYTLAGWDTYLEEINRRGKVMIVTSNVHFDTLDQKAPYKRITSRIAGSCYLVEVPSQDRRVVSI